MNWSAVAQGVSGLLGFGSSILSNNKNEKLMKMQQEYNEHMWRLNNEYNTPANQLARMLEAGINPNFDNQLVTAGTSDSPVSAPNAIPFDYTKGANAASQLLDSFVSSRNIEEDTNSKKTFNKFYSDLLSGQVDLQNCTVTLTKENTNLTKGKVKEVYANITKINEEAALFTQTCQKVLADIGKISSDIKVNDSIINVNNSIAAKNDAETNRINQLTPLEGEAFIAKIKKDYSDISVNESVKLVNKAQADYLKAKTNTERAECAVKWVMAHNYDAYMKSQIAVNKAQANLYDEQSKQVFEQAKLIAAQVIYQELVNDNAPIEFTWKNLHYKINAALLKEKITTEVAQQGVLNAQQRLIEIQGNAAQYEQNYKEATELLRISGDILGLFGTFATGVSGKVMNPSATPQNDYNNWFTTW